MKRIISIAALLFGLTAVAFGEKPVRFAKSIDVAEFDKVTVNGSVNIQYREGQSELAVSGLDEELTGFVAEVNKGLLKIDARKIKKRTEVTVYLSSPKLNMLKITGTGDFVAEDGIEADNFDARINGSSNFEINGLKAQRVNISINGAGEIKIDDLKCKNLSFGLSGAADAKISGKADAATVSINGSGDIDLRNLNCSRLNSKTNGSGKIRQ